MQLLSGADLILPDRILSPGTLVLDGGRIVDVLEGTRPAGPGVVPLPGCFIAPAFIDVHVHGVEGHDAQDPGGVGELAARMPRYGVAAFCPTTIACAPADLRRVLAAVREARVAPAPDAARVLPAHLESNFINFDYRGAQPGTCLRLPPAARPAQGPPPGDFTGTDILAEIEARSADVGIVTVAPELDGALELMGRLVSKGHYVSLGHSGATFEEGLAGIAAGARQATHLFNRMPPLGHRAPGLAGAVLQSEEVAAEVICDGHHVHPAMARTAIAAKHPSRILAITDGTAGAGLPPGSQTVIGGRPITIREVAYLDDGTIAGSVLTMDEAFRRLVTVMGFSPVDAATMCATTPARELGLHGHGVLAAGAVADVVVLDGRFRVLQTYVGGRRVFAAAPSPAS